MFVSSEYDDAYLPSVHSPTGMTGNAVATQLYPIMNLHNNVGFCVINCSVVGFANLL
jgi:hypothetical protein